ncbi:MAG: hypothetical protein PHF46_04305 [Candidatus Gracilibacteria bacterium]|nr:hypothetical protein [Candidatus Gracilibacteria bacterium]MDD4530810.1 hypothetical protein [Candidatus Gracilibacteria bacterium]
MEKTIKDFIQLMEKAEKCSYSNNKVRNNYIKKGLSILYKIETLPNFIEIILEILKNSHSFVVFINIAGFLRKYEPYISKKIYKNNINNDVMSGFLYDNWNQDQTNIENDRTKECLSKIAKYNKWKQENPEEYEKIIKELNDIIDNY